MKKLIFSVAPTSNISPPAFYSSQFFSLFATRLWAAIFEAIKKKKKAKKLLQLSFSISTYFTVVLHAMQPKFRYSSAAAVGSAWIKSL